MMDVDTMAELREVAEEGARVLLTVEAALKKLLACKSAAELEALDHIERGMLVAEALFKEIACAALAICRGDCT
jgi:hypothetical protein